jgi:glutathione S-transferase
MSQTALSILIAGAKYPKATTVLGISWCVFRTLFMIGYVYSDKPNGMGRSIGMPFWFAQGGLWALAFFGVAWPMMGSILM